MDYKPVSIEETGIPSIDSLYEKHKTSSVYVFYHAGCTDGFCAAYILWTHPPYSKCTFLPVSYKYPPPEIEPGSLVILVDFSYKLPVIKQWLSSIGDTEGMDILILDHHKSAAWDYSPHARHYDGEHIVAGQTRIKGCNIYFYYNFDKSGATITWEYVYRNNEPPKVVACVEDYDLWLFKHEGTKEINAGLNTYPFDFQGWSDEDVIHDFPTVKNRGKIVLAYQGNLVARAVAQTSWTKIELGSDSWVIPCVNSMLACNEIGDWLISHYDVPFCAVWHVQSDEKVKISLRGNNGIDLGALAKNIAKDLDDGVGGGHPNSAGLTIHMRSWEKLCRAAEWYEVERAKNGIDYAKASMET